MKRNDSSKSKGKEKNPYRNMGLGRVLAPCKPEGEPKPAIITSSTDLRVGGKK